MANAPIEGDSTDVNTPGVTGTNSAVVFRARGEPPSALAIGVLGNSKGGVGVRGVCEGAGVGVWGLGAIAGLFDGAVEVNGGIQATGGGGAGVVGSTSNANANGVSGQNTSGGNGVYGESVSGNAVAGKSQSGNAGWFASDGAGNGVWGQSVSGHGVAGTSQTGDAGSFTSGGAGNGVWGQSVSGHGVAGTSQTGDAGSFTSGGAGNGVWGQSGDANRSGVVGNNTGNGNGVWGASVGGNGVFGKSSTGFAGYFEGNFHVTGTHTVEKDIVLSGADCAEQFDVSDGCLADPLERRR